MIRKSQIAIMTNVTEGLLHIICVLDIILGSSKEILLGKITGGL